MHKLTYIALSIVFGAFIAGCTLSSQGSARPAVDVPQSEFQEEDQGSSSTTWQYKMTVVTDYGKSDALQETGTVVFNGSFSVNPEGAILFQEGTVTVSGDYRCRDRNSDTDPPTILEGTLSGGSSFTLEGNLIDPNDYSNFGLEVPLEPLTSDVPRTAYALLSLPKVTDRNPVAVSFGRQKCTGSIVPVIAEVVSFGEIPFFEGKFIPYFVVTLDPQGKYEEQIDLNAEGSNLLREASICISQSDQCL